MPAQPATNRATSAIPASAAPILEAVDISFSLGFTRSNRALQATAALQYALSPQSQGFRV
jgi:hypothetical protein